MARLGHVYECSCLGRVVACLVGGLSGCAWTAELIVGIGMCMCILLKVVNERCHLLNGMIFLHIRSSRVAHKGQTFS